MPLALTPTPRPRAPRRASPPARLALLASALLAAAACHRDAGVRGSGTVRAESRDVHGFHRIALDAVGSVTITQTGTESLSIEADDNLLPHLTSIVSGDRLTLGTDGPIRPTKPIRYAITVKDLSGLDIAGAGSATATGIHANAIEVHLSGAGRIALSGDAQRQEVSIEGAGAYDADHFATKTAKATVSGTGSAVVQVSDALEATIDGIGSIAYIGDPKVTKTVTGLGSVERR